MNFRDDQLGMLEPLLSGKQGDPGVRGNNNFL